MQILIQRPTLKQQIFRHLFAEFTLCKENLRNEFNCDIIFAMNAFLTHNRQNNRICGLANPKKILEALLRLHCIRERRYLAMYANRRDFLSLCFNNHDCCFILGYTNSCNVFFYPLKFSTILGISKLKLHRCKFQT